MIEARKWSALGGTLFRLGIYSLKGKCFKTIQQNSFENQERYNYLGNQYVTVRENKNLNTRCNCMHLNATACTLL